eukprot:3297989-Prymnesium_polylepis.2
MCRLPRPEVHVAHSVTHATTYRHNPCGHAIARDRPRTTHPPPSCSQHPSPRRLEPSSLSPAPPASPLARRTPDPVPHARGANPSRAPPRTRSQRPAAATLLQHPADRAGTGT